MSTEQSPTEGFICPLPIARYDRIVMGHGAGGIMSQELVQHVFAEIFDDAEIKASNDFAVIDDLHTGYQIVTSTDGHVVSPIFFPGGDIGRLAVCGTINDIAVSGAKPICVTVAFILEEGLLMQDLIHITASMKAAAMEADVRIVAGDTKVVEKGKADKIFIATTGIGLLKKGVSIRGSNAQPGDSVILTGTMGDHGIAVLTARGGLSISADVRSDVAPLNKLIERLIQAAPSVHVLRDPTRGGVATTLNEIACQSGVNIRINEKALPVTNPVSGVCDLLGFDPLYLANEGKLIVIVPASETEPALKALRASQYGEDSAVIGEVHERTQYPIVTLRTTIGSSRIIDMLHGEMLPRIC